MEVHQALVRGLSIDPAKRFPSMDELLSALSLEYGHSAGGAAVSRRRYIIALALALMAVGSLVESRIYVRDLSLWDMLPADGFILAIACGFGVVWRQTLLRNSFHRRVWLGFVLLVSQKLGVTLIAMHFHVPMIPYLAMAMIGLAGSSGLISAMALPRVWWLPLFLTGVACVAAIFGASALWFIVPSHVICGGAIALAWNSTAQRSQREFLGLPSELSRNTR
jgi:hypothetical protein